MAQDLGKLLEKFVRDAKNKSTFGFSEGRWIVPDRIYEVEVPLLQNPLHPLRLGVSLAQYIQESPVYDRTPVDGKVVYKFDRISLEVHYKNGLDNLSAPNTEKDLTFTKTHPRINKT